MIIKRWPEISSISALIITHCERLSEEGRKAVIQKFKVTHPNITKLMKNGIHTVGFPDQHHMSVEKSFVDKARRDREFLRTLIYFSEKRRVITLSI